MLKKLFYILLHLSTHLNYVMWVHLFTQGYNHLLFPLCSRNKCSLSLSLSLLVHPLPFTKCCFFSTGAACFNFPVSSNRSLSTWDYFFLLSLCIHIHTLTLTGPLVVALSYLLLCMTQQYTCYVWCTSLYSTSFLCWWNEIFCFSSIALDCFILHFIVAFLAAIQLNVHIFGPHCIHLKVHLSHLTHFYLGPFSLFLCLLKLTLLFFFLLFFFSFPSSSSSCSSHHFTSLTSHCFSPVTVVYYCTSCFLK